MNDLEARAKSRLAERMAPLADSLARAVMDQDPGATTAILTGLVTQELYALAVVLAERCGPPRCRNADCGRPLPLRASGRSYVQAKGWCLRCYDRWLRAGRPETGPPPPLTRAQAIAVVNERHREDYEYRLREFAEWRAVGRSVARAALEVGVSHGTGLRYKAELGRRREREQDAA